MASLTVSEKQHWKERITRRIEQRIERILVGAPAFLEGIKEQARLRAMQSVGLAEWQAELEAAAELEKEADRRERQAQRAMLAAVRRVPVEEVAEDYYGRPHAEVKQALERRQAIHEAELLAEHEQGRAILQLRQEQDELLDTIWLATSPVQIRSLWQKLVALLGEEHTPLQKEALALESAAGQAS